MAAKISYDHEKWPFTADDVGCIFNSIAYLEPTIVEKSTLRRMIMQKDGKDIISLIYSIQNGEAIIGNRASFGFPEIKTGISFKRVQLFLDEFYKHVLREKVSFIKWMHYPELYNTQCNPMISQALLNLGFIIEGSFLNYHLPSKGSFEKGLKDDTRRRLNKIKKSQIVIEVHEKFEASFFYDQLVDWRKKKGIPVNVSKDVLVNLFNSMNNEYVLFTAKKGEKLIAMSLGAKVTDDVLYYFLPSSDPKFDDLSPAIAIVQKIMVYAQENGIEYLDLGISSAKNEEENYGLIQFKEKLGGRAGIKYSYIKEIR